MGNGDAAVPESRGGQPAAARALRRGRDCEQHAGGGGPGGE